jgi:ribulose-bisphosphate carboxylase large chain
MIEGFNAIGKELELNKYAIFSYKIETPIQPLEAAMHLCQEQSTAQWKRVNIEEDFRPKHGAKVIEIEIIEKNTKPIINFLKTNNSMTLAKIKIAHPIINFGAKIPNLITASAGEGAFFTPGINSIKLTDVILPENYLKKFEGPKFGLEGIRKKIQVKDRPLFTGVVKPNIGLKPKEFAEIGYQALLGGLDIIKDDEMLADTEYSTIKERLEAVMPLLYKAEQKTGEKKTYLVNITDEVDKILELHDTVAEYKQTAVMLNAMPMGLSAARMLSKKTKIPVFSHFDFIAPFTRMPNFGVSSMLITKMQRLAGFDAIVMPGFGERMIQTDKEVKTNVQACLYDMKSIKKILPIPGGSDSAVTLPIIYEKLKTIDFSMVPGRGVFGHPLGPEAGAKSLRQAWEAITKGKKLEDYAKNYKELSTAINAFGQ